MLYHKDGCQKKYVLILEKKKMTNAAMRTAIIVFTTTFLSKALSLSTEINYIPSRSLSIRQQTKGLRIRGQRKLQSSNSASLLLPTSQYVISTSLACQLLGMNAATPTDFNFSFKGFSLRGGDTDIHGHGWGIAFYEGRGLRAFHDSEPCASSPVAELVSKYPMRTHNMIAHIRYATQGEVCLENVHPFHREMWGINWCFAHNGDVPLFKNEKGYKLPWIGSIKGESVYNPVGDTDSERIFCSLLNALKAKFVETLPTLPVLYDYIGILVDEIVSVNKESTILNFILGCGQHTQFCYSWPGARPGSNIWNGLHYVIREPPFKSATLSDCDYAVDFDHLTNKDDRVAVIATKPLTINENWIEFGIGELVLFAEGIPHKTPAECFPSEIMGHGLLSDVVPTNSSLEEDMRRFHYKKNTFAGSNI